MSMNQVWRAKIWTKLSRPHSRKKGMITALIRCIQHRKRTARQLEDVPLEAGERGDARGCGMAARDSVTRASARGGCPREPGPGSLHPSREQAVAEGRPAAGVGAAREEIQLLGTPCAGAARRRALAIETVLLPEATDDLLESRPIPCPRGGSPGRTPVGRPRGTGETHEPGTRSNSPSWASAGTAARPTCAAPRPRPPAR